MLVWRLTLPSEREDDQTVALRGSKSRNKVSVGEPAEGSLEDCLKTVFLKNMGLTYTPSANWSGQGALSCSTTLGPKLVCLVCRQTNRLACP